MVYVLILIFLFRDAVPLLDEYNEATVDAIGRISNACIVTIFVTYGWVVSLSLIAGSILLFKLFRGFGI
jgi:hypothetical protein